MRIPFGATTKRYVVIGNPIAYSAGPVIYNSLFKTYGLDAMYFTVNVLAEELPVFIDSLDMYGIEGFIVSIPHKKAIMQYLNVIEEKTLICESVNTVVKRDGLLYGYSTDAAGIHEAIGHFGVSYKGKNVLIVGAGAITPAIALDIAESGAKSIAILNRTVVNAQSIARLVTVNVDIPVAYGPMDTDVLCDYASHCDLLLNTTSLGLRGTNQDFENLDFIDYLPKNATVCDVIYSPPNTKFITRAEQRGLQVITGVPMYIYQTFATFELFTGIAPTQQDFDRVLKIMKKYLRFK
ncbi:MAG: shikimate dehydrogenase family protein [Christensenellales bacterium]